MGNSVAGVNAIAKSRTVPALKFGPRLLSIDLGTLDNCEHVLMSRPRRQTPQECLVALGILQDGLGRGIELSTQLLDRQAVERPTVPIRGQLDELQLSPPRIELNGLSPAL